MNLIKRNNLLPSSSFFDDFLTRDLFDWSDMNREGSLPRVNIVETNDDFMVEMAAPGMKKDDFQIQLDNDTLTISAELSNNVDDTDDQHYRRREFSYRSFKRSFFLPNSVEYDKIKAKYDNGILTLVIPKKEEAKKKPAKTIAIS